MDSIRIDSGIKRIAVNGDEKRVIEFNPQDIVFVEKFYGLIKQFEEKEVVFKERSAAISAKEGMDELGIPLNTADSIQLALELCNYLREQIDAVFGAGTSQNAFGEARTLEMFEQFFNGIMPFIQGARSEKMGKYLKDKDA